MVKPYDDAYYSMTWMGPKGYPENGNAGRCSFTGLLGMFRLHGESDVLFADGTSGDGFSFRWSPVWGAPAFNGGAVTRAWAGVKLITERTPVLNHRAAE